MTTATSSTTSPRRSCSASPTEVRDFLLKTSILDRLTGPLCDAVTAQCRRPGDARGAGASEPVPCSAGRPSRVVSLPPPLRGRPAGTPARRAADRRPGAAPAGQRLVRAERRHLRGHRARPGRCGLPAGRRPDGARHPGVRRERREAELGAGSSRCPTRWCGSAQCSASSSSVRSRWCPSSRPSIVGCRTSRARLGIRPVAEPGRRSRPSNVVVVDREGFRRLPGTVEVYHAALALAAGDLDGTVGHARQALSTVRRPTTTSRAQQQPRCPGSPHGPPGTSTLRTTGTPSASRGSCGPGSSPTCSGAASRWPTSGVAQGRLGEAMRTYERALELAAVEPGAPPLRGTADMHVGLAELLLDRDDLAAAAEHLARATSSGSTPGCRRTPTAGASRWPGYARPKATSTRALALLDEADRVYNGDYSPNVRPVPAERARLRVRRGELDHALAWARERQLTADDDLSLPPGVRARHPRQAAPGQARGGARGCLPRGGVRPPGPAAHRRRDGRRTSAASSRSSSCRRLPHQARGDTAAALAAAAACRDPGRAGGARARLRSTRARRWRRC